MMTAGVCGSCQSDETVLGGGEQTGLRVALDDVVTSVVSRSTPAELGKPLAEQFDLKVQNAKGQTVHNAPLTNEVVHLGAGTYSVTASYGTNPLVLLDAPYYVGTETVEVEQDQVTEAHLQCKVGNALVSVKFGRDAEEHDLFMKYYKECSLNVGVGKYSVAIPYDNDKKSAYVRAGSHVTLTFDGISTRNDAYVSTTLDVAESDFPEVLEAADHAIVTLSLDDPFSAAGVNISKVEMEEATLEETIPYDWLPMPRVEVEHQYDSDGYLVGTELQFQDSYFGATWRADVTNANGELVRTVTGQNALTSSVADNMTEWPYLPAGEYTATYYVIEETGELSAGERKFTIAAPDQVKVIVTDGYTSYDKYLEGDIEAANACNAGTIYDVKAAVAVSPLITENAHYADWQYTYTADLDGKKNGEAITSEEKSLTLPDVTGATASFDDRMVGVTVTFGGITAKGSKGYRITGLPAEFTPPTQNKGWKVASNKVTWNSDNVQLGQMAGAGAHAIEYTGFAIPEGVTVECPYKVRMHGATIATTLTLSMGEGDGYQVYFEERSSSGAGNSKNHDYESTATLTTTQQTTSTKARSSYGSGQTYSVIYSLIYKYGTK